MGLLDLFRPGCSFRPAELREITEDVPGPDRGWFRMYTYDLSAAGASIPDLPDTMDSSESLVLILIRIGSACDEQERNALAGKIMSIIDHFHGQGKDIILRVTYDTGGHALENEPYYYEQVLKDAEMIRHILDEAGNRVFVYQGLLVGNWGEMHTSRYTDAPSFTGIYDQIKGYGIGNCVTTSHGCFYAVRRPDIHMQLDNKDLKLGLFDDAILGSESDMGTYKDYESELEYESTVSLDAPNGGEAVYGGGYIDQLREDEVITFLRKKRITYLNMDYDPKLIERLKKKGNLFETVTRNMGYRFVIRKARYSKSDGVLQITVSNTGFAPLYRKTKSCIILRGEGADDIKIDVTDIIGRNAMPGENIIFQIVIPGIREAGFIGPVSVYLKTWREYDEKVIPFANTSEDDGSVRLGELYT
jgi:hypothetical protein